MPSPSKYHSSGKLYDDLFFRRPVSAERYIVRGYTFPNGGGENPIRPYNKGIKKANRRAEALGHKFNKAAFLRSLI